MRLHGRKNTEVCLKNKDRRAKADEKRRIRSLFSFGDGKTVLRKSVVCFWKKEVFGWRFLEKREGEKTFLYNSTHCIQRICFLIHKLFLFGNFKVSIFVQVSILSDNRINNIRHQNLKVHKNI